MGLTNGSNIKLHHNSLLLSCRGCTLVSYRGHTQPCKASGLTYTLLYAHTWNNATQSPSFLSRVLQTVMSQISLSKTFTLLRPNPDPIWNTYPFKHILILHGFHSCLCPKQISSASHLVTGNSKWVNQVPKPSKEDFLEEKATLDLSQSPALQGSFLLLAAAFQLQAGNEASLPGLIPPLETHWRTRAVTILPSLSFFLFALSSALSSLSFSKGKHSVILGNLMQSSWTPFFTTSPFPFPQEAPSQQQLSSRQYSSV